MLVAYHNPNVLTVYLAADGNTVETQQAAFKLIPGVNEVDKEQWAKVSQSPKVQRSIESGAITVEFDEDGKDGRPSITSVEDVRKAKGIIAKTYNTQLLKIWSAGDHRAEIISACTTQIARIMEETEKPKSEVNG